MENNTKISKELARELLWEKGVLIWLLRPVQKELYKSYQDCKEKIVVWNCARRLGKCLAEGSKILTPTGPVPIESLKIGDQVYGYNRDGTSSLTTVTNTIDCGTKEVVDLTSSNKLIASCSEDHVWLTSRRLKKIERKTRDFYKGVEVVRKFVDIPGGIVDEPNAYALGALLGDGCFRQHNGDVLADAHEKIVNQNIIEQWNRKSRLAFLAGLIDVDGSVSVRGNILTIQFSSPSRFIIDAFRYIFYALFQYNPSIGVDEHKNEPLYSLLIRNNLFTKRAIRELSPFLAKEKKRWKPQYEFLLENNTCETSVKLKKSRKYFAQCYDITVDNDTSLYLTADGLVTHNSWTLCVIAIETCLRNPNALVKYCCARQKDARNIIRPLIREIIETCPPDLKPVFKTQEGAWVFKNGGRIELSGLDGGRADSMRGGCLEEGTLISTPKGLVPIDQLAVGDEVYGYNADGSVGFTKVKKVYNNGPQEVVEILEKGKKLLACTSQHRWLVRSKSNVQIPNFYEKKLEDINSDDWGIVSKHNHYLSFSKGRRYTAQTYDIEVDNDTHLYLTADGLVTHNSTDLGIIDEAGIVSDLPYVVRSVLLPTTATTKGKLILASTPPKSPGHPFVEQYINKARIEGNLVTKTIYDNPNIDPQELRKLIDESGGIESIEFQREYCCKIIKDENKAILPEFGPELQLKIIKPWDKPAFFDAYVAMDVGMKDLTVVLFAYYDFKEAKIIVEDEFTLNGALLNTEQLALGIKKKEEDLWTDRLTGEQKTPFLRVSDNNLFVIRDLYDLHGLQFIPTRKDDADAALNKVRIMLQNEEIIIHPRCKTLIAHMDAGIWNKSRTSFENKLPGYFHFDAIDSLKYLVRNVQVQKNPYPAHYFNKPNPDLLTWKKQEYQKFNEFAKVFNLKRR